MYAGVTLIQTIIASDSTGKMLKHYRTTTIPGPAAQGYPALLTAVLSKLHHSKSNYEYTVSGICNPYLQVKVCAHVHHFSFVLLVWHIRVCGIPQVFCW